MKKKFVLIAGPSGTGKTSTAEALQAAGLKPLASFTTRAPRSGKNSDHEYISREEFEKLEGNMVAKTEFDGNLYGATNAQVEESDVYVIDLDGIDYFLENYQGEKQPAIYYLTASEETLFVRMILRGDDLEKVRTRIAHDRSVFDKEHISALRGKMKVIDTSLLTPEKVADVILKDLGIKEDAA